MRLTPAPPGDSFIRETRKLSAGDSIITLPNLSKSDHGPSAPSAPNSYVPKVFVWYENFIKPAGRFSNAGNGCSFVPAEFQTSRKMAIGQARSLRMYVVAR